MPKFWSFLYIVMLYNELSSGDTSQYLYPSMNIFRTKDEPPMMPQNETEFPPETTANYLRPVICECSEVYDPVCGSNNKSYYNQCQMACDLGPNTSVTVVHQGNCIPY